MLPRARTENLTIQQLPEETLVFDHQRGKAHCLNRTAQLVWRHCDGRTDSAALAALLRQELDIAHAETVLELALEQLGQRHLLQDAPPRPSSERRRSRRDLLKKMAALALPVILTVAAPRANAAGSITCVSNADCTALIGNFSCMVGVCRNNLCTMVAAANGSVCSSGNLTGTCLNGGCIFPAGTILR